MFLGAGKVPRHSELLTNKVPMEHYSLRLERHQQRLSKGIEEKVHEHSVHKQRYKYDLGKGQERRTSLHASNMYLEERLVVKKRHLDTQGKIDPLRDNELPNSSEASCLYCCSKHRDLQALQTKAMQCRERYERNKVCESTLLKRSKGSQELQRIRRLVTNFNHWIHQSSNQTRKKWSKRHSRKHIDISCMHSSMHQWSKKWINQGSNPSKTNS